MPTTTLKTIRQKVAKNDKSLPVMVYARFLKKLLLSNDQPEVGTCWLWIGATTPQGYGTFWDGRKIRSAHKWVFEYAYGKCAENKVLDHLCGVKPCANPAHLEEVTKNENSRRGFSIATCYNASKSHCSHGHHYDDKNTYIDRRGRRSCRSCKRETNKAWSQTNANHNS